MTISIKLEAELEQRIASLVDTTNRSKFFYMREMILQSIEDVEDIKNMEDYYLAEQTMASIKKGESKLYSTNQVKKKLGVDN